MGERRTAVRADETGTHLRIVDRWATVREEHDGYTPAGFRDGAENTGETRRQRRDREEAEAAAGAGESRRASRRSSDDDRDEYGTGRRALTSSGHESASAWIRGTGDHETERREPARDRTDDRSRSSVSRPYVAEIQGEIVRGSGESTRGRRRDTEDDAYSGRDGARGTTDRGTADRDDTHGRDAGTGSRRSAYPSEPSRSEPARGADAPRGESRAGDGWSAGDGWESGRGARDDARGGRDNARARDDSRARDDVRGRDEARSRDEARGREDSRGRADGRDSRDAWDDGRGAGPGAEVSRGADPRLRGDTGRGDTARGADPRGADPRSADPARRPEASRPADTPRGDDNRWEREPSGGRSAVRRRVDFDPSDDRWR